MPEKGVPATDVSVAKLDSTAQIFAFALTKRNPDVFSDGDHLEQDEDGSDDEVLDILSLVSCPGFIIL